MPMYQNLSLEEVEAVMAELRERRRQLKKTGKVAERKIGTLARRRERLMDRVRDIDAQIEALRSDVTIPPLTPQKRRGRRPKSAQVPTE